MKERFSTQVESDVAADVRATIAGLQRMGIDITLSDFTTAALAVAVDQARAEYNDGGPFAVPEEATIRRGRRLGL